MAVVTPSAPPPPRAPLSRRLIQLALVLVAGVVVVAMGIPLAHERALREDRHEAQTSLERIAAAQGAYFVEHGRYATSLSDAAPRGLGLPAHSVRGHYALSIEGSETAGGPDFIAQARNLRPGTDARCARFSLNREGVRGAQDTDGADHTDDCWR